MVHGQNTDNDRCKVWMESGTLEPQESLPNRGMERWDRRITYPTDPFNPLNHNVYLAPVRVLSVLKRHQ